MGWDFDFKGLSKEAPSCARVIWEYYGGHKTFPERLEAMMDAVDRSDSANLTVEEIQNPAGWILLSFIMDPRTGLGRYRDYRISNYKLMEDMIEYCRTMSADQILAVSDVQERVRTLPGAGYALPGHAEEELQVGGKRGFAGSSSADRNLYGQSLSAVHHVPGV